VSSDSLSEEFEQAVMAALEVEADKPLVVAIMGQTGVGKSTLINRLFGTNLKTDPVKPCTKEVEKVIARSKDGSELWFYDMPGIGEAGDVNAGYLTEYRRILLESDIALWAIHADVRSVSFDRWALDQILGNDQNEVRDLLSRITILLTKADHLAPPPWLYIKDGESGVVIPDEMLLEVIEAKQRYYFEALLAPYAEMLTATTYNDSKWTHELPGFEYTPDSVTYRGYLTSDETSSLVKQYPEHGGLLRRLRESYSVVACSSLLKYNLTPLMTSILTKLGRGAVLRFGSHFTDDLSKLTPAEAAACVNIVVVDERTYRPIDNTASSRSIKERLGKRRRR
jgi:energy-coupling factor transporter ATP-binding protein EcfA2